MTLTLQDSLFSVSLAVYLTAGAYAGTRLSLSLCLLVLSALALAILIGILSPHRDLTVEQLDNK